MSRSHLQVIFRYPTELELVFTYLKKQRQVLAQQGQPMLPYEILVGKHEIIVEFAMTDEDWDNPLGLGDVE